MEVATSGSSRTRSSDRRLEVRELFPSANALLEAVPVRLRCLPCEVAWSGSAESSCWVCGDPGTLLNTAVVVRERGGLAPFDFELFV